MVGIRELMHNLERCCCELVKTYSDNAVSYGLIVFMSEQAEILFSDQTDKFG